MSGEQGRMARCTYYGKGPLYRFKKYACCECSACRKRMGDNETYPKCECSTESKPDLAFFKAHPDREFDEYYCGCMSWE